MQKISLLQCESDIITSSNSCNHQKTYPCNVSTTSSNMIHQSNSKSWNGQWLHARFLQSLDASISTILMTSANWFCPTKASTNRQICCLSISDCVTKWTSPCSSSFSASSACARLNANCNSRWTGLIPTTRIFCRSRFFLDASSQLLFTSGFSCCSVYLISWNWYFADFHCYFKLINHRLANCELILCKTQRTKPTLTSLVIGGHSTKSPLFWWCTEAAELLLTHSHVPITSPPLKVFFKPAGTAQFF